MKRVTKKKIIFFIALLIVVFETTFTRHVEKTENIGRKKLAKVIRVIDGDTVEIENKIKVRYIGIDTPETVSVKKTIGCFGKEASNKNKELVEGKYIYMEKDVSETDKYKRLLRYIWLKEDNSSSEGIFVNDYLVRQGYAYAATFPPDVRYSKQFLQAQQEAKDNNRGLWSSCH